MTPTFSTVVKFTMKGILQRLHKLSYLSACESSEDIIFHRVQRRLLQLNLETADTFTVPATMQEIFESVRSSKADAIKLCNECGIYLETYDDDHLVANTKSTMEIGGNDSEIQDPTETDDTSTTNTLDVSHSYYK